MKNKTKKQKKDKYGMTEEDHQKEFKENLKRIALAMGITLGIPYLAEKLDK